MLCLPPLTSVGIETVFGEPTIEQKIVAAVIAAFAMGILMLIDKKDDNQNEEDGKNEES